MKYITIYHARRQNETVIIKYLFDEENITYRILKESPKSAVPIGLRVQVDENQVIKAAKILKNNGFLGDLQPESDSKSVQQFWFYLLLALILIILFSIFINR